MTSALELRECLISEIDEREDFKNLVNEYGRESAILGLPHPKAKMSMYRTLNTSGALKFWGAFLEDTLIGFITVVAPVIPHYGIIIAVSESVFVASSQRKTGAGLKLLRLAKTYSDSIGSPGLLISAPLGSNLAELLSHLGDCTETNRVFFWKTKNG